MLQVEWVAKGSGAGWLLHRLLDGMQMWIVEFGQVQEIVQVLLEQILLLAVILILVLEEVLNDLATHLLLGIDARL